MDRYIVREPRPGADYPQGNQIQLTFQGNTLGNNNMIPPDAVYYSGPYGAEYPNIQRVNTMGYMGSSHINQTSFPGYNLGQGQASGIDPAYLASYSNNVGFIAGNIGQVPNHSSAIMPGQAFVGDYQNRAVLGPDRNKPKTFSPQILSNDARETMQTRPYADKTQRKNAESFKTIVPVPPKKTDVDVLKSDVEKQIISKADKLKALQKSGVRAYSGSVENVLKWHKLIQDIGIPVLYEVVAKCVNIRPGESCSKHLVVRDENGPAMQVVYYEIDYLLPELKPPCIVRVVGRMMSGTCRLQAFSVRCASGDDMAALPRRSAVAAHHVAKLCKEFLTK